MPRAIIGFVSHDKGGTGKTTVSLLVAFFLRLIGYKVLLLDFEPKGGSSVILAPSEVHGRKFDTEVNPPSTISTNEGDGSLQVTGAEQTILGLMSAFINNESVADLFVRSVRRSTLFDEGDDRLLYLPPGQAILDFLNHFMLTNNNCMPLAIADLVEEIEPQLPPSLLKDRVVIIDTPPNEHLMTLAIANSTKFDHGFFVLSKYSDLDLMNVRRSVGAIKQYGASFRGVIPNGDRDWKSFAQDFSIINSTYHVLHSIPDMDPLANSNWVSQYRLHKKTIPTLMEICTLMGLPSRTPQLFAEEEEGKRPKQYMSFRIPLFDDPDANLTLGS